MSANTWSGGCPGCGRHGGFHDFGCPEETAPKPLDLKPLVTSEETKPDRAARIRALAQEIIRDSIEIKPPLSSREGVRVWRLGTVRAHEIATSIIDGLDRLEAAEREKEVSGG